MENIMHPQSCVNIRKIFNKFPDIIKLCFSIDKAEEIAPYFFLFSERKVGLNDTAVGAMHPFRINQGPSVFFQAFNVHAGM